MPENVDVLKPRGRPKGSTGVKMPCGWGCGVELAASEIRQHWRECPKRPEPFVPKPARQQSIVKRAMVEMSEEELLKVALRSIRKKRKTQIEVGSA